jgi:hypothetical protein
LAWINANALACVNSGVDLQPTARNNPAPKRAIAPKVFLFNVFLTFPPYTAQNGSITIDPPFFTYFPLLSMELQVTGRTLH